MMRNGKYLETSLFLSAIIYASGNNIPPTIDVSEVTTPRWAGSCKSKLEKSYI